MLVGKNVFKNSRSFEWLFFYAYCFFHFPEDKHMKKVKQIIGLTPTTQPVQYSATASEEPDSSYLARQAGLQTVRTSARGILKTNENAPVRKKLLGE